MSSKLIFGTAIAVILLGLYTYLIWMATNVVGCTPYPACATAFNDKMASALGLIGGLIGAFVISELSVTKPKEVPGVRLLEDNPSSLAKRVLAIVTVLYLGVWILAGLGALLVSWRHADAPGVAALTSVGESWFGLAIAAAYSYFGINRS